MLLATFLLAFAASFAKISTHVPIIPRDVITMSYSRAHRRKSSVSFCKPKISKLVRIQESKECICWVVQRKQVCVLFLKSIFWFFLVNLTFFEFALKNNWEWILKWFEVSEPLPEAKSDTKHSLRDWSYSKWQKHTLQGNSFSSQFGFAQVICLGQELHVTIVTNS